MQRGFADLHSGWGLRLCPSTKKPGTFMNENISPTAGTTHERLAEKRRFQTIVTPLGSSLAERTTLNGQPTVGV